MFHWLNSLYDVKFIALVYWVQINLAQNMIGHSYIRSYDLYGYTSIFYRGNITEK